MSFITDVSEGSEGNSLDAVNDHAIRLSFNTIVSLIS